MRNHGPTVFFCYPSRPLLIGSGFSNVVEHILPGLVIIQPGKIHEYRRIGKVIHNHRYFTFPNNLRPIVFAAATIECYGQILGYFDGFDVNLGGTANDPNGSKCNDLRNIDNRVELHVPSCTKNDTR